MKRLFILGLLLFASIASAGPRTNVVVTDGPGGWDRNGREIETQNPDDFVVIPGDITISGTTKLFGNTFSTGDFSHNGNVFIHLSSNQNITIDGSTHPREITDGVLDINHVSEIPSTRSINIDINANGQPNVKGQVINYTADQIGAGEIGQGVDINIIAGTASGGRIDAMSVTKVGNAGLEVHALHVNPEVAPLHQISGGIADVEIAFLFDDSGTSFTNVTTEFNSSSINIRMFDEDNDQVYVGNTLTFSEIAFSLATSTTGAGIKPTFEYSDGASGWIAFSPTDDTTNGMKNSGAIVWVPGSLVGWVTDTVNGESGKFWIRITRTQGNLSPIPVESFVDIVEGVNFGIDKNGDLQFRDATFRNTSTTHATFERAKFPNISGLMGVDGSGNAFSFTGGAGIIAHGFANRTTAYDFTPANTWSSIPLNGVDGNLLNITHSKTVNPERVAVDVDGLYEISYIIHCRRQTANHHCNSRILQNGTTQLEDSYTMAWVGNTDVNQVDTSGKTFIASLSANDFIEIQASVNADVTNEIDLYDDVNLADSAIPRPFASLVINRIGD